MLEQLHNTHSLTCDSDGCSQDVLGEDAAACLADAATVGWTDKGGRSLCPECSAGHTPALDLRQGGGIGNAATVTAPVDLDRGDAVIDTTGELVPRGDIIGYAKEAARAGQPVAIKMGPDVMAAIMGRPSKQAAINAQRGLMAGVMTSPEGDSKFTAVRTAEARQQDLKAGRGSAQEQAALAETLGEVEDIDAVFGAGAFDSWGDDDD